MMVELTRRDFLKLCLSTALATGLIALLRDNVTLFVKALERAEGDVTLPAIVWVECADCAGDTIALLDATAVANSVVPYLLEVYSNYKIGDRIEWWYPPFNSDLLYVLAGLKIDLKTHDTVRPEWGEVIEYLGKVLPPIWPATYVEIFKSIVKSIEEGSPSPYVLVLEGSLTDEVFYKKKYGGWNAILGEKETPTGPKPCTITEWFFKLCRGAICVVAAGTCAAYGGMPANYAPDVPEFTMEGAASHSPSGSMGFFPDPVKGIDGFVLTYRRYAHDGTLAQVWEWTSEEVKVFENALDPYYEYILNPEKYYKLIFEEGRIPLSWNANVKLAFAVPGCPANGNAVALVLAALVLRYLQIQLAGQSGSLAELLRSIRISMPVDEYWRPRYMEVSSAGRPAIKFPLFGYRTHEMLRPRDRLVYTYMVTDKSFTATRVPVGCPKFVYYKAGLVKLYPADGTPYCAYSVGCKGPVSTCPWNAVGWIIDRDLKDPEKLVVGEDAPGACTKNGAPCIGCVMPGFSDAYEPFFCPAATPRLMGGTLGSLALITVPIAVGAGAAFALRDYVIRKRKEAEESLSPEEKAEKTV